MVYNFKGINVKTARVSMSAVVKLNLHVDGKSLALAAVGPHHCTLKEPATIDGKHAVVEILIDGKQSIYDVEIERLDGKAIYFKGK